MARLDAVRSDPPTVTTSGVSLVWRNWARTEQAVPVRWERPRDVGEVVDAVRRAVTDGLTVRAVGSGHSFSGAAVAPGVLLDLAGLDRIRRVDAGTGLVTVEAGLVLHRLSPWLWRAGLSISNLGDIDVQTVAGALSTATHGTGLRFGSLSSQVVALELVLPDGSVVTCSPDERPDLFQCARAGIGAFGVVTAATLQCVPAFPIHAWEGPLPLAGVLDDTAGFAASADHAEFFWFPHTGTALAKRNRRLAPGEELRPQPRWRALLDDEVVANGLLGAVSRTASLVPSRIPAINRTVERVLSSREYVDRSYAVFASTRRVVFRESEYGVPADALPELMADLRRWLDRPGHGVGFPLEVRFGAAEEAWLGMAHGRETAWVAAQTHHTQDHTAYLAAFGEMAAAYDGRPHWGKLHDLGADRLRELYPRFADAVAVRDEVDPGRVLANPYTERVLGP